MGGACSTDGRGKRCIKYLVGKPEEKRQLGRPRRRWEDNIGILLRERGWEDVDWIHVAQDRVQWRTLKNAILNRRVP
jgi:hypothetical protein